MITRTFNAPEFRPQDRRTVEQANVAAADTRVAPDIQVGNESWRDKLLQDIVGTGAPLLNKMADTEFSNLYLEGQAAVGQIESEDELQGNPLTRDWKLAGYRDTVGKLALADMEAQAAVDMQTLREKSPEAMNRYLSERRAKFIPLMASMSREARATAAGQLLVQDRAALKTHVSEHTKFIIEKKAQAITTQFDTSMRSLQGAQMQSALGEITPSAFGEQIRNVASTIYGSIVLDNGLPKDVKKQLLFEAAQRSLAEDAIPLFDFLSNNEFPDGEGGKSTLLSRLDAKDRITLSNQYRESLSRTSAQRSMVRLQQVADLESQIDNDVYTGTIDDLNGVLQPMILNKSLTGEKYQGIVNKFLDKQHKKGTRTALGTAFAQGDINRISSMGKTLKDAEDAFEDQLNLLKASPEQRLTAWLSAGQQGMPTAFKKAGEQMGVALRQMRQPDGKVLPQHLQTFRTINEAVTTAERNGQANTRAMLLSGLAEEDRVLAERVFAHRNGGDSYEVALQKAKDIETKEAGMSPSVRASQASQVATEVTKAIGEMEPVGLLEMAWTGFKSLIPGTGVDPNEVALRPKTYASGESFFGKLDRNFDDNNQQVRFYANRVQTELAAEASALMLVSPGAKSKELMSAAKAGVMARTISTNHGPVILPRNAKFEQVFGVPLAMQSKLGQAIDAITPGTKTGSRQELTFLDNGSIIAQEYAKDGERVPPRIIEKSAILDSLRKIQGSELKKADEVIGSGKTIKSDGVTLNYSGRNSAGVEHDWMFDYRTNLVNHEGVRGVAYEDLSGRKDKGGNNIRTVGVGVSSHNPHFPKEVGPNGRVPDHAIQRSFLDASNDAAEAGARTARDVGVFNKAGFMLMSELAYQSGTAFLTQKNSTGERYVEFVNALRSGDVEKAQTAFKRTAAWYYSRAPKDPSTVTKRQKAYLDMIEKTIKE